MPPEIFNGLKWRLIGPFRGGRAVAVTGIPGDSRTFYFGAVGGGIWKTSDAGVVWNPVFDGQAVASIGALAVAPSQASVLYAGTGESDIRSDLSSGNGVYKSMDAGRTWTHLGLDDTRQISRIVVDPNDPETVYVAALGHAYGPNSERGVFKTKDGGTHWTKVLDQGPEIGASDVAICSGNPNLLFAGMWHTHRPPWSTYAPIDGAGGGLFRSQDAGKTWTRLQNNGLPGGDWGRVGVDVARDGRRVYALIAASKPGLYRSDDGGDNWALINGDSRLTGRAWYFSGITIDPQNADVVYMPNVALYRSEDGGKTISIVRGAPGGDDYHQIWIDPKDSSRMVLGTDQGTTISVDRGQTWSSWYNQPTAQLYHVTTDNKFPYTVYGAQQDTGSAAVPSRTDHGQITPRDWFPAGGSESGYMVIDASDPDIIYLSGTYGTVDRFNRRTGLSQTITPWPVSLFGSDISQQKYRAPWSPVLVSDVTDPKTLYFGAQYVLQSGDGGLHWEQVSPDLTGAVGRRGGSEPQGPPSVSNAKERGYGVISTIAPSPLRRGVIWAGSNTGLIHLTRDGGKSWKNVTPPGLADWSDVALIEASHFDAAVAYAAVNRSRLDDQQPYLYRTRDYGASWQPITDDMAAPAFLRAVREDPHRRGLLFAGTEFGIYVSFDDGGHWQSLQLNLPVTSVRDLTIHGDDLVVATHGRSFWILDNITPLRQAPERGPANRPWLFRPQVATRIDNDAFVGTPLPPEEPTAENPPAGAMIDYYLNTAARKVDLDIFDAKHNLVRHFSSQDEMVNKEVPVPIAERWLPKPEVPGFTPGMHRFLWDMVWGGSGSPDTDAEAEFRSPRGPKVTPGSYQVRLTVDGRAQAEALQIVMDPRSPASAAVLSRQFELGKEIFLQSVDTRRVLSVITSLQKRLADLQQGRGSGDEQLSASLTSARAALDRMVEGNTAAGQGSGLANAYKDLGSALRAVESGDREPPAQAIAVYEQSKQQIEESVREWNNFQKTQLPSLNDRLRSAHMEPINPGEKP